MEDLKTPRKLMDAVKKVSVGSYFDLILKENGTVWAMGENTEGELGTGDFDERKSPVQVDILKYTSANGSQNQSTESSVTTIYGHLNALFQQYFLYFIVGVASVVVIVTVIIICKITAKKKTKAE